MMKRTTFVAVVAALGGACHGAKSPAPANPTADATPVAAQPAADAAAPAPPAFAGKAIDLPGAPGNALFLDYLAYDRAHQRVWVPAAGSGAVDVIDVGDGDKLTRIDGFPTKEMERRGQKWLVGPTSASVGDGVVYVGNRGDSTICVVDAVTLKKGDCVTLDSMPDGTVWVASSKEVWVTAPRDEKIIILDASTPKLKVVASIKTDGQPEGYAPDAAHGLFYTNLEDKDKTLQIDVKTRKVVATWEPACGEDGPKGLALDHAKNFLMVACATGAKVLDAGHGGKVLGTITVGDGVDNIDYVEARHELYVGAARAAKLVVAKLGDDGSLTAGATFDTAPSARNGVATDDGVVYLADGKEAKILVVPTAK
jgi:DNA-binding beta-propeller fold protein YncE